MVGMEGSKPRVLVQCRTGCSSAYQLFVSALQMEALTPTSARTHIQRTRLVRVFDDDTKCMERQSRRLLSSAV